MARRISKHRIRKLGTIGNAAQPSFYLTLPIEYVRSLGWQSSQQLTVRKHGRKLIVEEPPKNTL